MSEHESFYEWDGPRKVRLTWSEDGDRRAMLIVTCADGSLDALEIVAVGRGRLLPAIAEVHLLEASDAD